ncbi:hypothetical protein [Sporosarcina aquimarina]|uniref:hypothetical protein n=1 Tax=Sporosarcina aquimarina TaxID=114975 RepID=UPI001C8DDDD8|nr:hypothetical protein [Sporosarcina aquimarina]MBY0223955.1 hypothetical protein [Sporosarcina aquimarina]
MKKGGIASAGFIAILFVVTFLYIGTPLTNGKTAANFTDPEIDVEAEQKQKEVEEILTRLYQKDGFIEQIGKN